MMIELEESLILHLSNQIYIAVEVIQLPTVIYVTAVIHVTTVIYVTSVIHCCNSCNWHSSHALCSFR